MNDELFREGTSFLFRALPFAVLISSKIMKHVPNYLFVFIQCLSEQELIYFQIIMGTGTIYQAQTTPKVY